MRGQLSDQGDGGFTVSFGHFERSVGHSDVTGLEGEGKAGAIDFGGFSG